MSVSRSTVLEVLRRAHRVTITDVGQTWRWACSCGRKGASETPTRGHAEGAAARHLRAAEKLVAARIGAALARRGNAPQGPRS